MNLKLINEDDVVRDKVVELLSQSKFSEADKLTREYVRKYLPEISSWSWDRLVKYITEVTGGLGYREDDLYDIDRIIEVGTGTYAYLNSSTNTWSGALTNFTDNYPYQYKVHTSHSTKDVYLAGNVEQEVQVMPYSCAIGYTMYGIREAGSVDVSALDLVDSGFTGGNVLTSDRFIDATSGSYAYYNTSTSAWAGGLTNIEPANVYKVKVQSSHTAFTWTYDPTDNPARNTRIAKKIHSNMK